MLRICYIPLIGATRGPQQIEANLDWTLTMRRTIWSIASCFRFCHFIASILALFLTLP